MNQNDMLKIAYEAGVNRAFENAGMEKEAIVGFLGKTLGAGLGKGLLGGAKYLGKTVGGLIGLGKGTALSRGALAPFEGVFGKQLGRDIGGFGLLSGGIGALTSEDPLAGFGKGMITGGLGGITWGLGGGAAKKMLGGLGKSKAFGKFAPGFQKKLTATKAGKGVPTFKDIMSLKSDMSLKNRMQWAGSKAMYGALPFGGAMAFTSVADPFIASQVEKIPGLQSTSRVPSYIPGTIRSAGGMLYGAAPGGYGGYASGGHGGYGGRY